MAGNLYISLVLISRANINILAKKKNTNQTKGLR